MACVNVTGAVTRSGSLTGSCTLSIEIRRDGVVVATLPVVAADNNTFSYAYQDTTAGMSHVYAATVLTNACGCATSTASFDWSISDSPCPMPTVATTLSPATGASGVAYNGTITMANATSATVSGLPAGLTASALVGNTITITGTPSTTGNFPLSVVASNACGTGPVSGPVSLVGGSLNTGVGGCINQVFVGGGFFPSTNRCGTTVNANANAGDTITGQNPGAWQNISAVNVSVSSPDLVVTGNGGLAPDVGGTFTAPGVYTATFTATSDQGCAPCTVVMRWTVAGASCTVNWSITPTTFVADTDTLVTYSATNIPAGCSLVLRPYNGNVPLTFGGVWPSVVLTDAAPSTTANTNWGSFYAGKPINWRPDPSQASCMTCAVTPARIDFTITGARYLYLTTCDPSGGLFAQTLKVANALGATAQIQSSTDSGVTWANIGSTFSIAANGTVHVSSDVACPVLTIVSASGGTYSISGAPAGTIRRVLIDGVITAFGP